MKEPKPVAWPILHVAFSIGPPGLVFVSHATGAVEAGKKTRNLWDLLITDTKQR